jgi:hypothetical protein
LTTRNSRFAIACEFSLKVIEISRANIDSFFDFALKVARTRDPSAMVELWTAHTQKQLETFGKQAQELTLLGQKLASKAADRIPRS